MALINLTDATNVQVGLFPTARDNTRLMQVMDKINAIWERGTLLSAAEGTEKNWKMKRENVSPGYTTNWAQVPVAI